MSNVYHSLFLRQSYQDNWSEYSSSLKDGYPKEFLWDYIILTASNEAQADIFRTQIDYRLKLSKLPVSTKYVVIPDPDGKRVGSGGATLNVLKYLHEDAGSFDSKKILVIHSGGDSKRVPQYSACGKLFSPVPRQLPDGRRSTLFDEFIIGMTGVAARIEEGMLVCSGDVLLLFNPLQVEFHGKGAAALSIKENVDTGKHHGVFVQDEAGNVKHFLHKQSIDNLQSFGAVDHNNCVDIDTGAVVFSKEILECLYALIDTDEKFKKFVNEKVRISFYADFLYPLATESKLEQFYMEQPEGEFCNELTECRRLIWDALASYKMKLIRFSPAAFIHFGTTKELLSLVTDRIAEYKYLDWKRMVNTNAKSENYSASNSYINSNAVIGDGSYIEDSYISENAVIGSGCIISGCIIGQEKVPDGTVLHGLRLNNGKYVVRMYDVKDNPKEDKLFGKSIDGPLWDANIYSICDSMEEAVKTTLKGNLSGACISLNKSFNCAEVKHIINWQEELDDIIKTEFLLEAIDDKKYLNDAVNVFNGVLSERAKNILVDKADKLDAGVLEEFSVKIRIYYCLSLLLDGKDKEFYEHKCFKTICKAILGNSLNDFSLEKDYKIVKDEVVTKLPVRVNWGGGWTDTPPYCMEYGGTVLNASVILSGNKPIEVVVKRIDEKKIILASTDNGSYKEFDSLEELQDCYNPHDTFALHKAALIACELIPYKAKISLSDILEQLGGGIYLSTQVINIPKGSGLGTSSILAAACVKGIHEFVGIDIKDNDLYHKVLCMEQIMSTGGGWQDQVGGLVSGIKILMSNAGIIQQINSSVLDIKEEIIGELNERFVLIYTGQRRLARNLLREVVGKYIANNPEILNVLSVIQHIALNMKKELESGSVTGFAKLLNEHWELSKRLDKGCTNACIEQIFISCDDLIDGKMICGAGGGGFLQVVLKKNVTVKMLRDRLYDVFGDSGVDVWECDFLL